MKPLKVGIIGLGIMGTNHLNNLLEAKDAFKVTAVCDVDPERFNIAEKHRIPCFTDYRDLLDAGLCEAAAVVTPHPCHAEIAIAAFRKGLHVLCEKPLAETMTKTMKLIGEAEKAGTKFTTNFSMRTTSVNKVIRQWIQKEKLGKILRVDFVCTEWIRAQKYYDGQSWRGTWKGEGGGILMNQAPHNLDLLYWWFGNMRSIRAELGILHHRIETEDSADAVLMTEAGFPIRFHANTYEAPGIDRIEIIGDKGTLIREGGKLKFLKLKEPVLSMLAGEKAFPLPKVTEKEVPVPDIPRGAMVIWRNFADAIRNNAPLIAPGSEAYHAVEFANAMTLSHFAGQPVDLPVSPKKYDALLKELIGRKKKI